MDPNTCLARFDAGMMCRDREEIAESADDMVGWLSQGGFLPSFAIGDFRAELSRKALTAYFRDCRHIAEML